MKSLFVPLPQYLFKQIFTVCFTENDIQRNMQENNEKSTRVAKCSWGRSE